MLLRRKVLGSRTDRFHSRKKVNRALGGTLGCTLTSTGN